VQGESLGEGSEGGHLLAQRGDFVTRGLGSGRRRTEEPRRTNKKTSRPVSQRSPEMQQYSEPCSEVVTLRRRPAITRRWLRHMRENRCQFDSCRRRHLRGAPGRHLHCCASLYITFVVTKLRQSCRVATSPALPTTANIIQVADLSSRNNCVDL
jgi:hypothetical protein